MSREIRVVVTRSIKPSQREKNNTNIYENTRIAGESRVNSERYQEYTMIVTGYSKNQLAPRVDIEAAA